jgi:hypothetical protein
MTEIKVCLFNLSVFNLEVVGTVVKDGTLSGTPVLPLLEDESNYPLSLRFGIPRMSSNEKIILASTFHTVFAFAHQVEKIQSFIEKFGKKNNL